MYSWIYDLILLWELIDHQHCDNNNINNTAGGVWRRRIIMENNPLLKEAATIASRLGLYLINKSQRLEKKLELIRWSRDYNVPRLIEKLRSQF